MKENILDSRDSRYIWRKISSNLSTEEEMEKQRLKEILYWESELELSRMHLKDCETDLHLLSEDQGTSLKALLRWQKLYDSNSLNLTTINRLLAVRALSGQVLQFLDEVTKPE